MRPPRARGTAIDAARIGNWLERFAGYRIHVSRVRINQWLDRFQNQHRDLAARILDAVEFFREDHLTDAYRAVFGRVTGWAKNSSERRGRWRFVAFSTHAGESGDRMLHTFRTATGLAATRFDDLFIHRSDLLREQLTADDTVVFVDDFAGTGNQAVTAWNESLGELLPGRPRIVLLLVVATDAAIEQIGGETPMIVKAYRHLRAHDNFFAVQCTHFDNAEKADTLHYCTVADAANPHGYGACGILLAFAHRCPNNSIPILHSNKQAFRGLFPR